jgi:hypothetical protein
MKQCWLRFFCFFALANALSFVTENAPSPENSVSLLFAIPTFLVFILFLSGLLSWGAFIRKRIQLTTENGSEAGLFDLAVGSILAYVAAYTLTAVSLFSSAYSPLLWAILATGFAFGASQVKPQEWFRFNGGRFQKFIFGLPLIILFLKLLEGLQFHNHGDAYITYLAAPRSWATLGHFSSYLKYTQFFLSTSWEALFAWGTALMRLHGGTGLDLTQWFSQWVSGGLGVLGIIFGLSALSKRWNSFFPIAPVFTSVALVAGLQVPELRWTASLAKNDIGIAFWGVALYFFSSYWVTASATAAFLTGLLCGSMVIGKLTLIILGTVLSVYCVAKTPRKSGWFILGGLTGVLPILLRNYVLTQNPIFPWLSGIFHTSHLLGLSESGGSSHATALLFSSSDLVRYLVEIATQIPLIIFLFMGLVFQAQRKAITQATGLLLFTLIAFTVLLRPATEIRYQGATLVLLAFASTQFVFFAITQVFKRKSQVVQWLLAVALLVNANISFYTLAQLSTKKYGAWPMRAPSMHDTAGAAKLWIRKNINPKDSILVVGDGYVYYLIDYATTGYGQNRAYETLVAEGAVDRAAETFKNAPFHYLYLSRDADYVKYREPIEKIMGLTRGWNQRCKLYDEDQCMVWDLNCLKSGPHL